MSTTLKIMRYELRDVLRSRSIIAYAAFFFVVTETLLRFAGGAKAALSLMNVVLLLIPLVSIVFSTIYLYHAREFTEMLLAQPVRRAQLFIGQFLGLATPLCGAFVAGLVLPFASHWSDGAPVDTLLPRLDLNNPQQVADFVLDFAARRQGPLPPPRTAVGGAGAETVASGAAESRRRLPK